MNSLITSSVRRVMKLQQPLLLRLRHPRQIRLLEPLLKYGLVLPKNCNVKEILLNERPAIRLYNLRPDTAPRILIYLHGGGYAVGSPHTHKGFAARLMQASGCERAYLPFYRLAPKYPYPTALNDVFEFWRVICDRYPDHELVLAGESAGAGLCLALFQLIRSQQLRHPNKIFLHSPWLDVGLSGDSYHDLQLNDGFLGRHPQRKAWLHHMFSRHYLGSSDVDDPLISPIHMDVAQLPPILIQVSTHEVFLADSQRLVERCRAQQIDCRLSIWPNLWHAFGLFAPWLPEANRAIDEAGVWMRTDR
jgi:monoterpene epsilon-lactone hydrolase